MDIEEIKKAVIDLANTLKEELLEDTDNTDEQLGITETIQKFVEEVQGCEIETRLCFNCGRFKEEYEASLCDKCFENEEW